MVYQIEVVPAVLRALKRIDRLGHARIRGAIALLAANPRPPGATALRGRDGWRVRLGNFRIIYTVQADRLIVVAVTIGHRNDVYEKCGGRSQPVASRHVDFRAIA